MKRLLLVLSGLILITHVQAQEPEIIDDSHTIYQVYLTTVAPGSSLEAFNSLSDLGFVQAYSIANPPTTPGPSRTLEPQSIYLGAYLGLDVAKVVLSEVQSRGYNDARIEADTRSLTEGSNRNLTYTVQLGAFNSLDMGRFAKIANIPAYGVYVTFENGMYKVFSGLYQAEDLAYLKSTVLPYLKNTWGFAGFAKAFRQPYTVD